MAKASKPRKAVRGATILTEQEKTFIHLSMKLGEEKAASTLGLKPDDVAKLKKSKPVQDYLKQYRHHFLREMARYELNRITQLPVSREDVVARLLALSLTPPEETKGTINGQVEALSTISEILGLKFTARDADAFFKDKSPEQLRNYARYGKFEPTEEEKKAIDNAARPDPADK